MIIQNWQIIIIFVLLTCLILIFFKIGKKYGEISADNNWNKQLPLLRKEIADKSRSILKGQISEQMAPYLPNFPFKASECKFMGNPVDFIVFKDLEDKRKSAVIFVEVKSGKSTLNNHERNLKNSIENKNVFWYEYQV